MEFFGGQALVLVGGEGGRDGERGEGGSEGGGLNRKTA